MRDLCDSAKRGFVCIDDICRGCDVTLCGFDKEAYDEMSREFFDEDPEETDWSELRNLLPEVK